MPQVRAVWLKALAMVTAIAAVTLSLIVTQPAPAAEAVYATGGGTYQNNVYWLNWDGATNWATAADNGGVNPGANRFKVGTTVTVSPAPGYFITATVVSMGGSTRANSMGTSASGGTNNMFMYGRAQDPRYSEMRLTGYDTGAARTAIAPVGILSDVRLTLSFTATRNGVPVPVDAVFTDGESANGPAPQNEYISATTDGAPWVPIFNTNNATNSRPMWTADPSVGVNAGFFTQTFGHFFTANARVPVGMSRDVDNVTIRVNSDGIQNAMFGFLISADRGDAPASYGQAAAIQPVVPNADFTTVDPRQNNDAAANAPRLVSRSDIHFGSTRPDSDMQAGLTPWTGDDTTGVADDSLVRLSEGTWQPLSHCMVDYTVAVRATAPNGTPVSGWIDTNNNGVFDSSERASGTVQNGTASLTFPDARIANSLANVGARFWISSEGSVISVPTGTSADGEVADFLIPVTQTCVTTVSKTSDAAATVVEGDTITYSVAVTNAGTGAFPVEFPATVSDNLAGILDDATYNGDVAVTTSAGSTVPAPTISGSTLSWTGPLQAGETATITYSVTVTRAGDGVLRNTATLPTDQASTPENPSSTVTTPISHVSLVKGMDPVLEAITTAGEVVNYTFTVTNDGQSRLENFVIEEQEFTGSGPEPVVTCPSPALDPGASMVCTAPYTVTQADIDRGSLQNTAIVHATPPGSDIPVTSDPSTVQTPSTLTPALEIVKTSDPDFVTAVGQVITYTYTLRNIGNVSLTDLSVTEGTFSGTGPAPVPNCSDAAESLAPGATTTCTATYTVTAEDLAAGALSNTATATGTTPDGTEVPSEPSTAETTTPDVEDVTVLAPQGEAATLDPELDADIVPSTVQFPADGQPVGAEVSVDGKTLTIPGEGVWVIDPVTGVVTFTPDAALVGNPTPVLYTGADANGNLAEPATLTVLYPDVEDVAGSGDQGSPVTVAADLGEGVDPTTVHFLNPDGTLADTLEVAGEGTWTVDFTTGDMTFTPEPGFVGDPTPVQYTAADAESNLAVPATVTVTYPDVNDVSGTGDQGQPVTVAPSLEAGMDATTVQFVDADGNTVSELTVAGEGVWTIDPATGDMTFTPEAGFQGDPTPVNYTALDADGNQASPGTVTVTYPDVDDIAGSGDQGSPVTIAPIVDANTVPTTVQLVAADGSLVSELTVAGEGVWSVDPATGNITFAPEAGFVGNPTSIEYTAFDADGNQAVPATVTVTYPNVADVAGSGDQGTPVTVAPLVSAGTDASTVQFVNADGSLAGSLTVAGEGTWTIDPATGDMTFTPEAGFQGDPTPINYTAFDADGNQAVPATVTVRYPDVSDVAGSGDQGTPVTVAPALEAGMDATTVQFVDADGNLVSELTVPGEGVWTVDPATGDMTFTPEAGFQGDPTPVQYTAQDAAGNQAVPATVTVTYPDIDDVAGSGDQGQPVTVAPALEAGMDATTVQFVDADGNPVSTLTVPGEGTWTIDPATGNMTFTPEAGFQGDPTPVQYTAQDAAGNQAEPATVTVTYPDVSDVAGSGDEGQPVTVLPSMEAGMDPTTVQFVNPDGTLTSTLTVAGEGVWTLDPVTGAMTFTPEAGFEGDPTPVNYTARDAEGNLAEPATVTVLYPAVAVVSGTGDQGQPVTVAPSLEEGMDPTTVQLVAEDGSLVTELVVPGEGTWSVDPETGDITFTPEAGFQGDPAPVEYTAQDAAGNQATPALVTVTYPDVSDVSGTGEQGTPVTVAPVVDANTDPTTVQFVDADGNLVSELTVPGEGVWTVDPATGDMTFTPEAGFQGDPTPVQYTAFDADGNQAEPATVTVEYPDVSDISGSGAQGQPVTVPVILDEDTDPTTVQLVGADGSLVTELTVPGEGVWSVDPTTGAITFTPEAGFQGDPTPVQYTARDADGNLAEPATVTVTYPNVEDIAGTGDQGQPVTVAPALDEGMDPTTVVLVDPNGNLVTELTVPGEGTWSVDPETGDITFTPEAGFQGDPTPVQYTARDADGNLAEPATVTVDYPDVSDVSGTGAQGEPVTVSPILDEDTDPTTVQFVDPDGNLVTELTVPGEGVWTVDPTTGDMTFTPEEGFLGNPTPVQYVGFDADGNVSEPATVTILVPDVSDVTGSGNQGEPATVAPDLGEGVDPTTVVFVDPDGNLVTELVVPGEGVWTVDPTTGNMTFTPEPGFQGDPTPVQYTARDADGNLAVPATVTVDYPDVSDVTGRGAQGEPVTVSPILDEDMDPTTVQFVDPDGNLVTELTVPGEGVWTVDPTTGDMTFTPEEGFLGNPTPVQYVGFDADGNVSEPATVTILVPDVSDVTGRGDQGEPATVVPDLGEGVDPTTVVFVDPDGNLVTELTVPGEGVWTVDPTTGNMTFTPEPGFQGDPTPVQYTARDTDGNLAEPATVTVTYPDVDPISGSGTAGTPVTVTPIVDESIDPTTIVVIDPDGNPVKELVVPGEGTWTVDPETGDITFTPEPGFEGNPTPVDYTGTDVDGNVAEPAPVTITYEQPADGAESVTTPFDTPVTIDPFENYVPANGSTATPDAATFQFVPGDSVEVSEDGLTATTPDGVFVYDPATGLVTFTPADGFVGSTPLVPYTYNDSFGVPVSSTMDVTVTPPVLPGEETPEPTPVPTPVPTPTPEQPIPGLPVTGGQLGFGILGASLLLLALGALLLARKKKEERLG